MKAIVIGGGIGGLTTAIALQKAGIEAHVYERARSLGEVGAGISLWVNAVHALDQLGLGSPLRSRILWPSRNEVRTWRGAMLSSAVCEDSPGEGMAVGVLHRADLLAMLSNEIEPARLHLEHECTGFTQDEVGIRAQFANGENASGDVLVGCDGLRSIVRAELFGASPPRYAGYTAWRAIASLGPSALVTCETWGPGRRFGTVPMTQGRVYWYATKNAAEGERDSQERVKETLLKLFSGWHKPIVSLIEATDAAAILRNDIYDRDPLSHWSHHRVTLLGDAAHPMTPNLGQGACQAIEDAVVLAACLAGSSHIDSALQKYEERRVPRTSKIALLSRRIGGMAQWENPLMCSLRNIALRAMPKSFAGRQMSALIEFEALTE
jgi:2-polyprenyl-6-methoxyphenol hydroxylase-like FAD-dependent oxidoreductase